MRCLSFVIPNLFRDTGGAARRPCVGSASARPLSRNEFGMTVWAGWDAVPLFRHPELVSGHEWGGSAAVCGLGLGAGPGLIPKRVRDDGLGGLGCGASLPSSRTCFGTRVERLDGRVWLRARSGPGPCPETSSG